MSRDSRRHFASGLVAGLMLANAALAVAQEVPPPPVFAPPPVTPQQPGLPPPPDFSQPQAFPAPGAVPGVVPPGTSMKKLFVGTISTVAQATGVTLLTGLTQAITGGITNWFNRRLNAQQGAAPVGAAFPQPVAQGQVAQFPVPAQQAPALPPPPVFDGSVAAVPPPPAFAAPTQFHDAATGAPTTADPAFAAALASGPAPDALFAGLAFEVHAVVAGGATTPVNPANHEFHTGDRFKLFYRPTLPGHMDVFNINPAGIQTQIDSVEIAAGQLAELGPYEFAATRGDDQLKLVLSPCQTPALVVATRDIINVSATAPAGAALGLASCGPRTRSIDAPATRDIRKVAVEGTTGFALDPVSAQEMGSGQFAPRTVTIVFRHR